jgi:outer membrane receptor protein involved in Fe transport
VGYKFNKPRYSFMVTPYYSLVKAIAVNFPLNTDGSIYAAFTPSNRTRDYGVEVDGECHFGYGLALRAALTWQNATAIDSWQWTQPNGRGPLSSAVLVNQNAGYKAENLPNYMATITPSYTNGRFLGQVQWEYMGARPANNNNAFNLPAYQITNVTLQWRLTRSLSLSFVVNNVFGSKGVVGWREPGNNIATNAEAFTAASIAANPNATFAILQVQATACFAKATYNF